MTPEDLNPADREIACVAIFRCHNLRVRPLVAGQRANDRRSVTTAPDYLKTIYLRREMTNPGPKPTPGRHLLSAWRAGFLSGVSGRLTDVINTLEQSIPHDSQGKCHCKVCRERA